MSLSRVTSRLSCPCEKVKPLLTREVGTRCPRVGGATCSCKETGQIFYTAAIGTAWSLLRFPRTEKTASFPFQKHYSAETRVVPR